MEKNFNSQAFDYFKESLVKVCSESTSHGLPNIFKTKNWIIRIFWLILFLGGSGAALYCKNNKEIFLFPFLYTI